MANLIGDVHLIGWSGFNFFWISIHIHYEIGMFGTLETYRYKSHLW